jgi:hypothetical protein
MSDLWRRWHMTLSRLARDLIYVPLCLGHPGTARRFAAIMLTMIVIGIWHGAGWTFVVWGAYNGVLLIIVQVWQTWRGTGQRGTAGRLLGWAMTFTSFALGGGILFRSPDLDVSWHLLKAVAGMGSATTATAFSLDWDLWIISKGYVSEAFVLQWFGSNWTVIGTIWTAVALAVALFVPDTMEITGYKEGDAPTRWRRQIGGLAWQPSPAWAGMVSAIFIAAFVMISRVSEFLYYQF